MLKRVARGFTLTELMMALVVVTILAALAYPAYQGQVSRSRRVDAIAMLLSAQQAQEKWRGNHPAYATLADIQTMALARSDHYRLDVSSATASSYVLVATATGTQTQDRLCAVLKLTVVGGQSVSSSGTDASASNPDTPNRRCWNS